MAELDGKWNCTVASPVGDQSFVLTVRREGDGFTGSAEGAIGGKAITDGMVEGDTLRWTMHVSKPVPVTLACTATIDGDMLSGSVKAGFLGSYPITGTRA
jgi:hypothetical protein